MNRLERYLNKSRIGLKAISLYKNWAEVILFYFNKTHNSNWMIARLRSGENYAIRNDSQDIRVISDIYMNKPYHRYLPILRKGGVAIDIGANIGAFSVLAAKQNPSVRVFSFEPFESNIVSLKKNVSLNKMNSQIRVTPLGIASQKGKRDLFIDEANSGGHTLYGKGKKSTVSVISLSDAFEQNKIESCDLLKLDCEGAEFEILLNTPISLYKKIKTITLEFHEKEANSKAEVLVSFLTKAGYTCTVVGNELGFIYAKRR